MGVAQIILLSLYGIILLAAANRHGKPIEGKVNFWAKLVDVSIVISLLYWGDFSIKKLSMDREIVKMVTYENIATIAAIVIIWLCTGSAWSLLLMLNLKTATK